MGGDWCGRLRCQSPRSKKKKKKENILRKKSIFIAQTILNDCVKQK